ncbi:MAG: type II toxin-antitoxin system RelE/ParE family toxin [Methylovulum miyakonense]|uniref:type II toxin-antitoxin system RelE/ParE family toxin n=1 Tax=Methylovulum miyakonense TaxID=645578 RepID=UPI003BB5EB9A
MAYKLVISPQADRELEEIAVFIAEDSPARAILFVDELLDSVQNRLTEYPYIGKPYKSDKRMLFFKGRLCHFL